LSKQVARIIIKLIHTFDRVAPLNTILLFSVHFRNGKLVVVGKHFVLLEVDMAVVADGDARLVVAKDLVLLYLWERRP